MIITAKFASRCPVCTCGISVGSKVEWSKGAPARHLGCAQPARRSYRGRWNGCSCGAREMPDGSLSSNACAQCRFDNE